MLLQHKISLLMVLSAAAPTAVAGWSTLAVAERSAIRDAEETERAAARAAAGRVAAELDHTRVLLRLFAHRSFDFGALSADDMLSAEKLIHGLDDRITIVSILRSDGSGAAPSYYAREGEDHNRPPVSPAALADHAAQVPLTEALAAGDGTSDVYRNSEGSLRIAVAAVAEPSGDSPERAVIAAEVSMNHVLESAAHGVAIFNAAGKLVGGSPPEPVVWAAPGVPARWADGANVHAGGMLASYAAVPGYTWGIVATRPLSQILAPARELRRRIIAFTAAGALLALVVGFGFARTLVKPLRQLSAAAYHLGEGDLDHRVPATGTDEIGLLGSAFNHMAAQLQASAYELKRFAADLESQVQARTSELREAIDQLLLAHRLAAIGQLGAGVAHEINNPLTYVVGALQIIPNAPTDKQPEMLAKCLASAKRIQAVVAGLLQVSQAGDGERQPAEMNSLIDNALRLVEGQLGERNILVERHFARELPRVHADPSQMIQALVQILNNARDAMDGGGTLRIETHAAVADKLVMVRIVDTGRGIPVEHLDRLFDPFFTTRANSGHKGLGLSLTYRIITDHGGHIHADSTPGKGTTFTLRLPALPRSLSLA